MPLARAHAHSQAPIHRTVGPEFHTPNPKKSHFQGSTVKEAPNQGWWDSLSSAWKSINEIGVKREKRDHCIPPDNAKKDCPDGFVNKCTDPQEQKWIDEGLTDHCNLGIKPVPCVKEDGQYATCEDGSPQLQYCLNDYYDLADAEIGPNGLCVIPNNTDTQNGQKPFPTYAGTPVDWYNSIGTTVILIGATGLAAQWVIKKVKSCLASPSAHHAVSSNREYVQLRGHNATEQSPLN